MMYKNNETTICRLCLEPVTNFICTDCLFDNIQKWVSANSTDPFQMRALLRGKHSSIRKMLSNDTNRGFCVSCKSEVDEIACPCCYLYEMGTSIRLLEPRLVEGFERDFNFDVIVHHNMSQVSLWESMHGRILASRSFRPILITDKRRYTDLNSCESCEVDSEELADIGGHWICESCRDEAPE